MKGFKCKTKKDKDNFNLENKSDLIIYFRRWHMFQNGTCGSDRAKIQKGGRIMKTHVMRSTRGMDLKKSIEEYVISNNINAGIVGACVGSLYEAQVRPANKKVGIILKDKYEIVSMTGTLSKNGCHIHISLSDGNLLTVGGHLKEGCFVNTTAEIVIIELDEFVFTREPDENTGFKELSFCRK